MPPSSWFPLPSPDFICLSVCLPFFPSDRLPLNACMADSFCSQSLCLPFVAIVSLFVSVCVSGTLSVCTCRIIILCSLFSILCDCSILLGTDVCFSLFACLALFSLFASHHHPLFSILCECSILFGTDVCCRVNDLKGNEKDKKHEWKRRAGKLGSHFKWLPVYKYIHFSGVGVPLLTNKSSQK